VKILHIYETISGKPEGFTGCQIHNSYIQKALRDLGNEVIIPSELKINPQKELTTKRDLFRKMKKIIPERLMVIPRDLYDIYYDRVVYNRILKDIVNKSKPDIIFERFTIFHQAGCRLSIEKNIPYLLEIHSPVDERGKYFSSNNFVWYTRKVLRYVSLKANAIIVVSCVMKDYLVSMGIPKKKITVIPNAVDKEIVNKISEKEVNLIKNRYHLEDSFVVGFIGSMAPYHGIDFLINAAKDIISKNNRIKFLMVGAFYNEKAKNAMLDMVCKHNLKDYFIFTGNVSHDRIPSFIEAMDACTIPSSNYYGSPIKLFEYGSLGKTVIASRFVPIEEIIEDEKDGLLFEPGNINDFTRKLLDVSDRKEYRENMGKKLQKKILSNHTWQHNAQRIMEISKLLIKNRG
jgi:glycosyltransferase involved in cell wall biosynthesis